MVMKHRLTKRSTDRRKALKEKSYRDSYIVLHFCNTSRTRTSVSRNMEITLLSILFALNKIHATVSLQTMATTTKIKLSIYLRKRRRRLLHNAPNSSETKRQGQHGDRVKEWWREQQRKWRQGRKSHISNQKVERRSVLELGYIHRYVCYL